MASRALLETGNFIQDEFKISTRIELRYYIEKVDKKLGTYCLITSFVQTDKGTIEMIYDEGFLGDDALSRAFYVFNNQSRIICTSFKIHYFNT